MRLLALTLFKSSIHFWEGYCSFPLWLCFCWMLPSGKEFHQSILSLWKVLNSGCFKVMYLWDHTFRKNTSCACELPNGARDTGVGKAGRKDQMQRVDVPLSESGRENYSNALFGRIFKNC